MLFAGAATVWLFFLLLRRVAMVWLVAAPLWSFYFMFTHPRSWLDRDDVKKTNAYLAANDHNDFLDTFRLTQHPKRFIATVLADPRRR